MNETEIGIIIPAEIHFATRSCIRIGIMIRLTKLREQFELNKSALGRKAQVDGGVVSRIERGRLRPPPGSVTLKRLARALKLPTSKADSLLDEVR